MNSATRMKLPAPSLPMTLLPSDRIPMPPHIRKALFLTVLLTACHTSSEAAQPQKPRTLTIRKEPESSQPTAATEPLEIATTTTSPPNLPEAPPIPRQETRVPAEIVSLVHQHFDEFGVDTAEWFLSIVWRESNGQADAWNRGSGCYGLAQIALPVHAAKFAAHGWEWQTSWMDPDKNLTIAADIYRSSGRGPWSL